MVCVFEIKRKRKPNNRLKTKKCQILLAVLSLHKSLKNMLCLLNYTELCQNYYVSTIDKSVNYKVIIIFMVLMIVIWSHIDSFMIIATRYSHVR